ncbi:unnamed protein product, partial [Polarella glacialis]
MMPLVVTEAPRIATYSSLTFVLDNAGRPERGPCSGSLSCCSAGHSISIARERKSIPCDKISMQSVLEKLYAAKMKSLANSLLEYNYTLLETTIAVEREKPTLEEFVQKWRISGHQGRNHHDLTLLGIAAFTGNDPIVRELLEGRRKGEPWYLVDKNGLAAFHMYQGYVAIFKFFLETGDFGKEQIDGYNTFGAARIHQASEYGCTEMLRLLLANDAEVDLPKRPCSAYAGRTALHCAAERSQVECCEILIRHGASVHTRDAHGATVLHMAALEPRCLIGNQDPNAKMTTVRLLLEDKADPSVRNDAGHTAAELLALASGHSAGELWLALCTHDPLDAEPLKVATRKSHLSVCNRIGLFFKWLGRIHCFGGNTLKLYMLDSEQSSGSCTPKCPLMPISQFPSLGEQNLKAANMTKAGLKRLSDEVPRESHAAVPVSPTFGTPWVEQRGPSKSTLTPALSVNFPMKCVRVMTFMEFDVMPSYGELLAKNLLVEPSDNATVHLISHEWLSRRHPDPDSNQLRRMQGVFLEILAGRFENLFSKDDWITFSKGASIGSQRSQLAAAESAHHNWHRISTPITEDTFKQDIEEGLIWLDWSSIPQVLEVAEDKVEQTFKDQLAAIHSIGAYVDRSSYFWILAPKALHKDQKTLRDFSTYRTRAWCRLEEWANLLSSSPMMPLVVTEAPRRISGHQGRDEHDSTLLHIAAQTGNHPMVRELLERRCKGMDGYNKFGAARIHMTSEYGRTEMLRLLLASDAEVDLPKRQGSAYAGRTALHCAALRSQFECCEILIRHSASVHARDAHGATVLHMAALEPRCLVGNQDPNAKMTTVRLLLEAKADPSVRNDAGHTAAELVALASGHSAGELWLALCTHDPLDAEPLKVVTFERVHRIGLFFTWLGRIHCFGGNTLKLYMLDSEQSSVAIHDSGSCTPKCPLMPISQFPSLGEQNLKAANMTKAGLKRLSDEVPRESHAAVPVSPTFGTPWVEQRGPSKSTLTPALSVNFPMKCVRVMTFMEFDVMPSYGELLVCSSRSLQDALRNLFSKDDWITFSKGASIGSQRSQLAAAESAHHNWHRISTPITEDTFKQDIEEGLIWLDWSSIPQVLEVAEDKVEQTFKDQLAAIHSIGAYVDRSSYFWILAPKALHKDQKTLRDFSTYRTRAWCRLEEWANLLSSSPMMPLVVTEAPRRISGHQGRDEHDSTLLHIAAQTGNHPMVRELLERQCKGEPWLVDSMGHAAFQLNLVGSVATEKLFLETGDISKAQMDGYNKFGAARIHMTSEYGRTEMLRLLLASDAEVDLPKRQGSAYAGRTALHCAALRSQFECCEILIRHSASVHARDAHGATVLHMAALEPTCLVGNQDPNAKMTTVRLLLEAKADPSVRNDAGHTAAELLELASGHGAGELW